VELSNHPENAHDLPWLQKHGQCLDGVYPNTSTVKYAGRGAFTTRDVEDGGLIAPAPLLIIDDKNWLVNCKRYHKSKKNLVPLFHHGLGGQDDGCISGRIIIWP